MSAGKITTSTKKRESWESTRALDREALKLVEDGWSLEEAYREAVRKVKGEER